MSFAAISRFPFRWFRNLSVSQKTAVRSEARELVIKARRDADMWIAVLDKKAELWTRPALR